MIYIWFKKFIGLYDKQQVRRTEAVGSYVHRKKSQFTSDMTKIRRQAKITHKKALQLVDETTRLQVIVDDVTAKIALVTGNIK